MSFLFLMRLFIKRILLLYRESSRRLRTSLCLQFKPRHIAAGAIFLAAKFLKVKLPSDGEKVWWQEFDVTPRRLEEVSNQMLELYEQNQTGPSPSHGSEAEASGAGGANHRAPSKGPAAVEEPVSASSHSQVIGPTAVKHGGPMSSSARMGQDQSYHQSRLQRSTTSMSNDYGGNAGTTGVWDHKVDGGSKDVLHSEQHKYPTVKENMIDTSNRSKNRLELPFEESERSEIIETAERTEWKDEGLLYKLSGSMGPKGYGPPDAIKRIDKEKVKATLEKRRKSRNDVSRRTDAMDENDIIERELENGVELAAEDEKIKRERRKSWSKPLYKTDHEKKKLGKVHGNMGDKSGLSNEHHLSRGNRVMSRSIDLEDNVGANHGTEQEDENAEEGELSSLDAQELYSPKSGSRKRRAMSPEKDGWRLDYLDRDSRRHKQENHI